jgi:thiopurine S-methyltransferase
LLRPGGKLAGVLFDIPLYADRPPYGGSKELYVSVFKPYFRFITFEKCYNSIPPRAGNELFMILEKHGNQSSVR